MKGFYLTRRAILDIRDIYDYSVENWAEIRADEYVNNLYIDFNRLANNIELGESRKNRSFPFLMYPSGRHYIVYEFFKESIIVITVLHQVRNIENIINEFSSTFYNEIEMLKLELKEQ